MQIYTVLRIYFFFSFCAALFILQSSCGQNSNQQNYRPNRWVKTIYSTCDCKLLSNPSTQAISTIASRFYFFDNDGFYMNQYALINGYPKLSLAQLDIETKYNPSPLNVLTGEQISTNSLRVSVFKGENMRLQYIPNQQDIALQMIEKDRISETNGITVTKILAVPPYSLQDADYGAYHSDLPSEKPYFDATYLVYRERSISLPKWITYTAQDLRSLSMTSKSGEFYKIPTLIILASEEDIEYTKTTFQDEWKEAINAVRGNGIDNFITVVVIMPYFSTNNSKEGWTKLTQQFCQLIQSGGTRNNYWGNLVFFSARNNSQIQRTTSEWLSLYRYSKRMSYGYWQADIEFDISRFEQSSTVVAARYLFSLNQNGITTDYEEQTQKLWSYFFFQL